MKNNGTYTFEEAFQASLAYFDGDELAARVWVNKYALKDSFGNIYEKSPAGRCSPCGVIGFVPWLYADFFCIG